MKNTKDAV